MYRSSVKTEYSGIRTYKNNFNTQLKYHNFSNGICIPQKRMLNDKVKQKAARLAQWD